MAQNVKYYIKELLNIALPIIMGNLGFILIGAGDVQGGGAVVGGSGGNIAQQGRAA